MTTSTHAVWVAWLLTSVYYFYQYALCAAPAVMMPQLSHALNLNPVGIASLAAVFYYGYSPFGLVAGAAIDRFGAKTVVPLGALITGAGAILFGFQQAQKRRRPPVGSVPNFPASQAATFAGMADDARPDGRRFRKQ
jgi:fucose permease